MFNWADYGTGIYLSIFLLPPDPPLLPQNCLFRLFKAFHMQFVAFIAWRNGMDLLNHFIIFGVRAQISNEQTAHKSENINREYDLKMADKKLPSL